MGNLVILLIASLAVFIIAVEGVARKYSGQSSQTNTDLGLILTNTNEREAVNALGRQKRKEQQEEIAQREAQDQQNKIRDLTFEAINPEQKDKILRKDNRERLRKANKLLKNQRMREKKRNKKIELAEKEAAAAEEYVQVVQKKQRTTDEGASWAPGTS